jgi:hypothetical protein
MEVSGQIYSPAALLQEKSPRYKLDRRLSGTQRRSGRGSEEKFAAPAGTETPDHSARSLALYHWAIPAPTLYV